jgi:PPE-repeat protein
MDFAALPPEVNSGRMYAGPGLAPMLSAAAAWDGLAAELHATAAAYAHQVENLTGGPWLGQSAMSMAAAVTAHVQWLAISATRAQETAAQARAAAEAYEAAFLSTVPPAMISANRSQLIWLVATNILGQNGAAIATTEAQYAEMWAQDAAAMYEYAGASAGATTLTPFTAPAPTTDSTALAAQAAAVAHISTSTGTSTALSKLASAIPTALQNLASPIQSTSLAAVPAEFGGLLGDLGLTSPVTFLNPLNTGLTVVSLGGSYWAWGTAAQTDVSLVSGQQQISDTEAQIMQRLEQLGPSSAGGPGATMVSASSGRAALIGGLSMPQGWVAQAPAIRLIALTSPTAVLGAAAEGLPESSANLLNVMGLSAAATAGRIARSTAGLKGAQRIADSTRAGSMMPPTVPDGPLTGIAAELYQLAGLRDLGILTDEEFFRRKSRLLGE